MSLIPVAMRAGSQIARNPRVRRFVRVQGIKLAKSVGRRSFRRIQSRRRRKGRRILFPQNSYRAGNSGAQNTLAPVRVMTQRTTSTADQTVSDTEKTMLQVKSSVGDDSSTLDNYHLINPMDNILWPRLSMKAVNFTEYTLSQLVLTYTPCVGTSYNGTIAIGFNPQSVYGASDYTTSIEVLAMQQSMCFSAGSPAEFRLDCAKASQGGANLFLDNTGLTPDEFTRYYAGAMAIRAYNCEDSGKVLGTFQCTYICRLMRPRLSVNPSSAYYNHLTQQVVSTGSMLYKQLFANSFSTSCLTPLSVILRGTYLNNPEDLTVELTEDGETHEPAFLKTDDDEKTYIAVFNLGLKPRRRVFVTQLSAGATYTKIMAVSLHPGAFS